MKKFNLCLACLGALLIAVTTIASCATTSPERTLLLVDDEENVLRSLARLFRRDGYQILTAGSVREAFDLLASRSNASRTLLAVRIW